LKEQYVVSDHTGFAFKDRAYFCGGNNQTYGSQGTCFSLSIPNETALDILDLPPLPTPRADIASVSYDNYAIVSGGFTDANNFCAPLTTTERLNIPELTWSTRDDLTVGRGDLVLVKTNNGGTNLRIYAIGGKGGTDDNCARNSDNQPLPGEATVVRGDVELYDVAKELWTVVQDIPASRSRVAAVGYADTIYSFGGQHSFNATCQCFPTSDEVRLYEEIAEGTGNSNETRNNTTSGGASTSTWWVTGVTIAILTCIQRMTGTIE
jgi:hypothetical protein